MAPASTALPVVGNSRNNHINIIGGEPIMKQKLINALWDLAIIALMGYCIVSFMIVLGDLA